MRSSSSRGDALLTARHRRTRDRGVLRCVHRLARLTLTPALRFWLDISITGQDHVPASGPVILAPNHRSFLDPFVVALGTRRTVYFVAKEELFARRWQGWILNALGAFPCRRGESDQDMIVTAERVLERGDVLLIFPEGTRVRHGDVGVPKRGMARLALRSGATVVPVRLEGTQHVRDRWKVRRRPVTVNFTAPIAVRRCDTPDAGDVSRLTASAWTQVTGRHISACVAGQRV